MPRRFTVEQAKAKLRKIGKEKDAHLFVAFREGMRPAGRRVREGIKRTSLGRALWTRGAKKNRFSTPPLLVRVQTPRVSRARRQLVGGVKLRGFAAMIEEGGRTEPHKIEAKRSGLLKFEFRGRTVFRKSVRHPGSPVKAEHVAEPIVQDVGRGLVTQLDGALTALSRRLGLAR